MKKHIFVDLDGTLFDTQQLGVDTAHKLQAQFGISAEDYEATRQDMFKINNKIYSAEIHARILARKLDRNQSELVSWFIDAFNNENSQAYVFNDSVSFLNECTVQGKVMILTYGEAFVQIPRTIKSGLRKLVHDTIVTQTDKATAIKNYFAPLTKEEIDRVFLVDDSIEHLDTVKSSYPDAVTIHIKRGGHGSGESKHRQVTSLDEALDCISEL